MKGEWNFSNAGGCSNNNTFDKNPAYCINVQQNQTQVFFRLMVTSEVSPGGQTAITDMDQFQYSIGG